MSDRSDTAASAGDEEDNLDYLDAGLSEDFHEDTATTQRQEPPARDLNLQAAPMPQHTEPIPAVVAAPEAAARNRSWLWPIINLVGLVIVVLVNAAANTVEFNNQSTGDVVNKNPVPFQPAGWVFAIWGVIYALLGVFVIYGLLPAGRRNVRLQRISPFFLIANIANVTWLFLWHWEQYFASVVTMLVLLGSLLCIYVGLRIRNPTRPSDPANKPGTVVRLVLWVPFSVYLGWVIVASLANVMVWLDRSGWDGGPFSYNVWAALFMLGGAAIAAGFVLLAKDVLIPLVLAFAFAGICQHAWGESALVVVMAIVMAVVCVGLAGLAWVLAYENDVDRGPFGKARSQGTPPPMTSVDDAPSERA
jgi:hypothetical protein